MGGEGDDETVGAQGGPAVPSGRAAEPGKLQLQGFNNLTKTVTFNLYALSIARTPSERASYEARVDREFGATRMAEILHDIARIIEAEVLSVSTQDYEPHGASALMLMSDIGQSPPHGATPGLGQAAAAATGSLGAAQAAGPASVAAHLDKSHLCAHSYPDWEDPLGVCCLRVDIEISTCGTIMPLRALNHMLRSFACDVVTIDYVVRGFTRDTKGRRVYLDHSVDSLLDFVDPEILGAFEATNVQMAPKNTWQATLMRHELDPASHLPPQADPTQGANAQALALLHREMRAIYASR